MRSHARGRVPAVDMTDTDVVEPRERTFFGQPRVLANLFGVEMWERFSFYGMQGILLIYLYYSADRGRPGHRPGRPRPASSAPTAAPSTCPRSSAPGWPTGCSAPSARCSTARSLVMAGHIALALLPGPGRGRRRPGPHRVRQRRRQGQRDVAGRHPLRRGRRRAATPASRSSTWASTSARSLGPLLTGLLQTTLGLPLRLRARRRRHGHRPDPVHASAASDLRRQARRGAQPAAGRAPAAGTCVGVVVAVAVVGRRWRCTGVLTARAASPPSSSCVTVGRGRRLLRGHPEQPRTSPPSSAAGCSRSSRCSSPARRSGRCTSSSSRCVTIYSDEQLDRDLFGWTMPVSWVQSINPVFIIILSGVVRRASGPSWATGSRRPR